LWHSLQVVLAVVLPFVSFTDWSGAASSTFQLYQAQSRRLPFPFDHPLEGHSDLFGDPDRGVVFRMIATIRLHLCSLLRLLAPAHGANNALARYS
jgi:hypothetical protein